MTLLMYCCIAAIWSRRQYARTESGSKLRAVCAREQVRRARRRVQARGVARSNDRLALFAAGQRAVVAVAAGREARRAERIGNVRRRVLQQQRRLDRQRHPVDHVAGLEHAVWSRVRRLLRAGFAPAVTILHPLSRPQAMPGFSLPISESAGRVSTPCCH